GAFEGAMLVEQGVAQARLARDVAHRRRHLAGHDAEERRLAGAVAPDDAPAIACGDREGDVLEEFRGAERNADARHRNECHVSVGVGRVRSPVSYARLASARRRSSWFLSMA